MSGPMSCLGYLKETGDTPEKNCAALLESLPLVYSSLEDHQKEDSFCKDLRDKIEAGQGGVENFQVQSDRLCYYPKGREGVGGLFRSR